MSDQDKLYRYPASAFEGRVKLTGITIDGPDTRDMDDGISLEQLEDDKWRVQISIADPSTVIVPGGDIDQHARDQAFTLYRPGRNKTMLPIDLDHDRLSLVQGYSRPAVTLEMIVDRSANVSDVRIFRSEFQNERKTTYAEFQQDAEAGREPFKSWSDLSLRLLDKRRQEGALAFYDMKHSVTVDEEGNLRQLKHTGHRGYIFIQEMMILANRIVAEFMDANNIPALYRNHAADVASSGEEERETLIHTIKEAIAHENIDDFVATQNKLRFWFKRARYEAERKGHFGLHLPAYLHFTSPIRRYADLVVHRNLTDFLEGRTQTYSREQLAEIGQHLNMRMDEERDSKNEAHRRFAFDRASRQLTVRAYPGFYAYCAEHEIEKCIEVSLLEGHENPGLRSDIFRRLQDGSINIKILTALIKANKPDTLYWNIIRSATLDHLRQFPSQAITLLTHMSMLGDEIADCTYEGLVTPNGYVEMVFAVIDGERITTPVVRAADNKPDAKKLGVIAFWEAYVAGQLVAQQNLEIKMVEPKPQVNKMTQELAKNPISQLNECSQKNGFDIQYESTQGGSAHKPFFRVTVTLSGKGFDTPRSFQGTGAAKQDARAVAASKAVEHLAENQPPSTKVETNIPTVATTDPVSSLNELQQKRGWPVATFNYSQVGPDHNPQFTCTVALTDKTKTSEYTAAGTDTNKKDAKKAAAAALLQQLQQDSLGLGAFAEAARPHENSTQVGGVDDQAPRPRGTYDFRNDR